MPNISCWWWWTRAAAQNFNCRQSAQLGLVSRKPLPCVWTLTSDPHTARTRRRARTGVLPATEHRRGRSAGRNCRQRCRQNCGQNCGQLGRSSTATNATCIRLRLDAGRIDRGRMASEGRTAGCWARGQRASLHIVASASDKVRGRPHSATPHLTASISQRRCSSWGLSRLSLDRSLDWIHSELPSLTSHKSSSKAGSAAVKAC
jgi:hypothetical protein